MRSCRLCVVVRLVRGALRTLAAAATLALAGAAGAAELPAAEVPGPSAALFAKPFYVCARTYYVAPTGSDAHAGSRSAPWATLQHADAGRVAGDCVQVAPGTYPVGLRVTRGGDRAAPDGYVVYRCQTLGGCRITAPGGNGAPAFTFNMEGGPNYVVIDGFELAASHPAAYGVGIFINNNPTGGPTARPAAHHVWMLNNIIHGYGEAGIGTNESDWLFVLHNTVYDTARVTCDAQGSGIGLVVAKATPGYTPTAADQAWAPFHQVVAWNVAHGNMLTQCGTAASAYDTDGNGIIIDTFNGAGVDDVLYPDRTLVAHNIVYGNGGKGIMVFRSSHVTVANNTAYDNNLDPWNAGFPRGEIHNAGGADNLYLNNIVHAVPATSPSDPRCQGATYAQRPAPCPLMANAGFVGGDAAGVADAGNAWTGNVSFGGTRLNIWGRDQARSGNYMFGADRFSCAANRCADPSLADPRGGNFALSEKSAAIGYGQPQPYLPPDSLDAGACHRSARRCP